MIMAMKERTGRSRVSKADEVAAKINVPAEASQAVHSRVRPSSKTDEIARKIPGASNPAPARPARVRPASKADEIGKKIPAPQPAAERPVNPVPQQPSSRVIPVIPVSRKRSGCCLLPFTLAVLGISGSLIVIF